MQEQVGDLWDFHNKGEWICITINGNIKGDFELVMGKGCALEAKKIYPNLPEFLGFWIKRDGLCTLTFPVGKIFAVPTKYHWRENSNLQLIEISLQQLVRKVNFYSKYESINKVYLPRLGCGLGNLDWNSQVKPLCEKYLDDRFVVLTK